MVLVVCEHYYEERERERERDSVSKLGMMMLLMVTSAGTYRMLIEYQGQVLPVMHAYHTIPSICLPESKAGGLLVISYLLAQQCPDSTETYVMDCLRRCRPRTVQTCSPNSSI